MNTQTLGKRGLHLLEVGIQMPKNELTKEELKNRVLKLKDEVYSEPIEIWQGDKNLAHKYLNKVLNIIEEYRY